MDKRIHLLSANGWALTAIAAFIPLFRYKIGIMPVIGACVVARRLN
jgi:hypothetical protein